MRTILHHIRNPWAWTPSAAQYFYCDNLDCDVAYFGADDSVILKSQLRSRLTMTEVETSNLLCYCFGATMRDIERNPGIRDFIIAHTKSGDCSCETSNPSGACCLGRLPKIFPAP